MKNNWNARFATFLAFALVSLLLLILNSNVGRPPHKTSQTITTIKQKLESRKKNNTVLKNATLNDESAVISRIKWKDDAWLDISESKPFLNYGDGSCSDNELREVLMVILQKWIELATTLNINYFLSWGTLLGAWRNADIIPYDLDLDIFVTTADALVLEKRKSARNFTESDDLFHFVIQEDWTKPYEARKRFACDGEKVTEQIDHCSFEEPFGRLIKGNYHIDIYEVEVKGGFVNDFSVTFKQYPTDSIFPLKKCLYMGEQVYCPNKPRIVLETLFGKDLSPDKVCEQGKWISQESN